jgi:hypothetical protein
LPVDTIAKDASQQDAYLKMLAYRPIAAHTSSSEVNGDGVVNGDVSSTPDPSTILLLEYSGPLRRPEVEKVLSSVAEVAGPDGLGYALRTYELIDAEGFGGRCRKPARLPEGS